MIGELLGPLNEWSQLPECDQDDILKIFRETGVLLEGHFRLTSGKHSPQFLQCAQVLRFPRWARLMTGLMTRPFKDEGIRKVVGPALGGIILSYEGARWLDAEAIFTEKGDGDMRLRRGFQVEAGERVLILEDAVSTGASVNATMEIFARARADIVGVSVLVDRTGGEVEFGVPFHAVSTMDIPAYAPSQCPLCRDGVPIVHPKDLGM